MGGGIFYDTCWISTQFITWNRCPRRRIPVQLMQEIKPLSLFAYTHTHTEYSPKTNHIIHIQSSSMGPTFDLCTLMPCELVNQLHTLLDWAVHVQHKKGLPRFFQSLLIIAWLSRWWPIYSILVTALLRIALCRSVDWVEWIPHQNSMLEGMLHICGLMIVYFLSLNFHSSYVNEQWWLHFLLTGLRRRYGMLLARRGRMWESGWRVGLWRPEMHTIMILCARQGAAEESWVLTALCRKAQLKKKKTLKIMTIFQE